MTSDEVDEPKIQCGFGETQGLTPEMFDPGIHVGTELLGGGFSHISTVFLPKHDPPESIDLCIFGFWDLHPPFGLLSRHTHTHIPQIFTSIPIETQWLRVKHEAFLAVEIFTIGEILLLWNLQ